MCRGVAQILILLVFLLNGWFSAQSGGKLGSSEAEAHSDESKDFVKERSGGLGFALSPPDPQGNTSAKEAPLWLDSSSTGGGYTCSSHVLAVWALSSDGQEHSPVLSAVRDGSGQLRGATYDLGESRLEEAKTGNGRTGRDGRSIRHVPDARLRHGPDNHGGKEPKAPRASRSRVRKGPKESPRRRWNARGQSRQKPRLCRHHRPQQHRVCPLRRHPTWQLHSRARSRRC